MQNKCNCGQGFVPVSGNWDFINYGSNGNCGCSGYSNRNARRRSNNCGCDECETTYTRERETENCQCERCDDSRTVECCDQNTYIRDVDECNGTYTRSRSSDCDACNGNTTYTRSRSSDCDECNGNSTYNRNRSSNNGCKKCGCDEDNGSTYARSRKNDGVGMVKGYMQEIDEIFESESALRAGTLFPELHKPLNGYCPCDENCGTCAQAAAFAAWEMRLYLNTHPHDEEALKLFRKLCKEAEDENYATTFLEDDCCTTCWNWVKNPWPWEYTCQCGD